MVSVVLDRELSVEFDRPLSFLQNRAPIILYRPFSFFGFIHFEILGKCQKRRIKQAYLEFFEKLSFFVEKTSTFISRFCTINRLHLECNFVIKRQRYTKETCRYLRFRSVISYNLYGVISREYTAKSDTFLLFKFYTNIMNSKF